MVPKSDHLANPRFDKKPSAHRNGVARCADVALEAAALLASLPAGTLGKDFEELDGDPYFA